MEQENEASQRKQLQLLRDRKPSVHIDLGEVQDRLSFIEKNNEKIFLMFKTNREFCNDPSPRIGTWQRKVDIYNEVQKRCNRPGYFWYGYKYYIIDSFVMNEKDFYTLEDMINKGFGFQILSDLQSGFMDPQKWCDEN